jgi:hypothetical protein
MVYVSGSFCCLFGTDVVLAIITSGAEGPALSSSFFLNSVRFTASVQAGPKAPLLFPTLGFK